MLRPYQISAIENLRKSLQVNRRIILQSATGSGKTVIAAEMVRLAVAKGTQVLILTHRIEIFRSTLKTLSTFGIQSEEIRAGKNNAYLDAPVLLSMVETLKRRLAKGLVISPKMVVVDECHFKNFSFVFDKFPDAYVIGLSATPKGSHIAKFYQDIIHTIEIQDLIDGGFLVPSHAFQMQDDFSDIKISNGEFEERSMFQHYDKEALYKGVVDNYKKYANELKTVVFNCNISHAEKMNHEFNVSGIHSELVTGNTPDKKREQILSGFNDGLFPVINSVGCLTTGWDCASIQAVILNRCTQSLPLYLQMLGRASRPHHTKTEFVVLDFGGNSSRHNIFETPRKWELKEPKKKKIGVAPVKDCPNCEAVIAASSTICKFCGYEIQREQKELKEGVMVEIKPQAPTKLIGKKISTLTIDEIIELCKSKKFKSSFCWRVIRSKGELAIDEYAAKMGYSRGWSYRQKQDIQNSQFNDYLIK